MFNKYLLIIQFVFSAIVATSMFGCSSDEEKYASHPPVFEDVEFHCLSDGSHELKAGEPFVATVIQKQKGKLLNNTKYRWEFEKEENVSHKYKTSVIYDKQSENPTDTITITTPGRYELVFSAEYNLSGLPQSNNYSATLPDGTGSITCNGSTLKYLVTIRKKFRIQ